MLSGENISGNTVSGALYSGDSMSGVYYSGAIMSGVFANHMGPQRWNDELGKWEDPQWTFNTQLGDGQYVCGVGYHPGLDNPNGVFTGDCRACTPITNQSKWTTRGNGNNNCDFECKYGYVKDPVSRVCKASVCGGVVPAHASAYDNEESTNVPQNTSWTYSANDVGSVKCQFKCDAGYERKDNQCKAIVYSCGTLPQNAQAHIDDDQGLTQNGAWKYSSTNTPVKCEFTCKSGYEWKDNQCKAIAYSCIGSAPTSNVTKSSTAPSTP